MIWRMVNLEEFKEIYKVGIDYENNSVVVCSIDRTTICKNGKVRHSKSHTMKQYEDYNSTGRYKDRKLYL